MPIAVATTSKVTLTKAEVQAALREYLAKNAVHMEGNPDYKLLLTNDEFQQAASNTLTIEVSWTGATA